MEIENQEQDTQLQPENQEQEIFLSPEFYTNIGDGTLTIQKNGTDVGTFTANQSNDTTINIPVPTTTSELTNDANFQNSNDVSNAISAHNQSSSSHQDIRQAITDEATTRLNADNGLQGQIDAITSSSDVVDIVGTYAELEAYDTQHLKDNDVIKVLQDETHNDAMTYWRWSKTNETWTYIGSEGPYYTKSETNTLLDEKLDADEVPDGFFDGPATITPTEGTSVEVEGGLKLKSVNLKGDTTQQTYSGKNLMPLSDVLIDNNTRETKFKIDLPAGTYTISFDLDSFILGSNSSFGISMGLVDSSGTQFADKTIVTIDSSTVIGRKSYTFTTTSDASASYNSNIRVPLTQYNNGARAELLNIQIESGSTATSYEPYVGGIASPNPNYPQTINVVTGVQNVWVHGKNLFNNNATPTTKFNDSSLGVTPLTTGVRLTSNASVSYSGAVYIIGKKEDYIGKTLTFTTHSKSSSTNNPRVYIGTCNSSGGNRTAKANETGNSGEYDLSVSWQVVDDDSNEYVCIVLYTTASVSITAGVYMDYTNAQLEIGNATSYDSYQGANYTVDLGSIELCKIGTYQDYIYKSGDDWYIHKETTKTVFDGTENWNYGSISSFYRGSLTYSGWMPSQQNLYNSHFITGNTGNTPNVCGIGSTQVFMSMDASLGVTTKAEWLTWLSNNNVTMYTILATSTDTKITDSTLIGQLNAVLNATLYQPTTTILSSGNLPAILGIVAYTEHLNSLLEIAAEPLPEQITYNNFVGTDGVNAGTAGLVPAPATTDVDKFLKSDGTWDTAGGGSSVTVVQTTGTSQTDVMSQNAVSSMVYADPSTTRQIRIGNTIGSVSNYAILIGKSGQAANTAAISIGNAAQTIGYNSVAIGADTLVNHRGSVALGSAAQTTVKGQIMVGTTNTYDGYNSTNYRLVSGVHDGQNANDAVNLKQLNALIDDINTALGTSIPHQGA